MVTQKEYEDIAGYTPVPGKPCPECKAVCGSGGPDHHGTCPVIAKLWNREKNPNDTIPKLPGVDVNDPMFGVWATKLANSFFNQPVAIPKHGPVMPAPNAPVAVAAPLSA